MKKREFYDAVFSYKASMKQAETMLEKGIISFEEYRKIDAKIAQKYGLNLCSIYAYNDLIYSKYNGNMQHKEVHNQDENNRN